MLTREKTCSIVYLVRQVRMLNARVAQLVEHDLAKVGAAGSSPVSCSEDSAFAGSFFHDNKILAKRRFYCRYSGKNCIFYLLDFDKMCYT